MTAGIRTRTRLAVVAVAAAALLAGAPAVAQAEGFTFTRSLISTSDITGIGTGATELSWGDLNGDGHPDPAAAAPMSDAATVLETDPATGGFFRSRATFPTGLGSNPVDVELVDVDGDGARDVVIATLAGAIEVRLNAGSFSFAAGPTTTLPGGARPVDLAAGDLNGDGDADLAVQDYNATTHILLGDGSGGFAPAPSSQFAVGGAGYEVMVADLDGDGALDVVPTTSLEAGRLTVLFGDGSGGFDPADAVPGPAWFLFGMLELGDVNGDGALDIVGHDGVSQVHVLLGAGDGMFAPAPESVELGGVPTELALGDLDLDGRLDLAAVVGSEFLLLASGNGDGTFQTPVTVDPPVAGGIIAAEDLDLIDLDGDGRLDVVVFGSDTDNSGAGVIIRLDNAAVADATPPVLTVPASVAVQAPTLAGATATFAVSAVDAVDGPVAAVCSHTSGDLFPLGITTVTCSAEDGAGNSAAASFPVRVTVAGFTATPPATSTLQTAQFAWSALLPGQAFQCALDGAPFGPCSSPRTYRGLAAGPHELCVRATADVAAACWAWTIVSPGAPETMFTLTPPPVTASRTAAFAWTSDQPAPRYQCSLDGAAFALCSSPRTYRGLAAGTHTLRVRAVNFAGDIDPTPAVFTWTITP